jgi:hypothetical protein
MILNMRGESKLGCLFSVLILVLAIWCAFKIIPPYYNSTSFYDSVEAKIREAANYRWDKAKIERHIWELATKHDQPEPGVDPRKTIKLVVNVTSKAVSVEVVYSIDINLGFYTYTLNRDKSFRATNMRF